MQVRSVEKQAVVSIAFQFGKRKKNSQMRLHRLDSSRPQKYKEPLGQRQAHRKSIQQKDTQVKGLSCGEFDFRPRQIDGCPVAPGRGRAMWVNTP